jgi:hypothetical protein
MKNQEKKLISIENYKEAKQRKVNDLIQKVRGNSDLEKLAYLQANFEAWTEEYMLEKSINQDPMIQIQVEQYQMDKIGEFQSQIDAHERMNDLEDNINDFNRFEF